MTPTGTLGRLAYVPLVLFFAGFLLLMVSLFRPTVSMTCWGERSTVILAMDISGSMKAEDVAPNRFQAAVAAAEGFIDQQPADVLVGIVGFAETASLVQPPTADRWALKDALRRFSLQPGTAVGSGILASLQALNPKGDMAASAIVLLTDGQTTNGPDPKGVARAAATLGVRVYTVGFGAEAGAVVDVDGRSVQVHLDSVTLVDVAELTGAKYFHADTAAGLYEVYDGLTRELMSGRAPVEITALFAAAAVVVMIIGAGLSIAWTGRIL